MPKPRQKKKEETDYIALQSPFMRIPRMHIDAARALLDIGVSQIYELVGRSPEALFADLQKAKPGRDSVLLPYFRMAVYFAENQPNADAAKLHPSEWTNPG